MIPRGRTRLILLLAALPATAVGQEAEFVLEYEVTWPEGDQPVLLD